MKLRTVGGVRARAVAFVLAFCALGFALGTVLLGCSATYETKPELRALACKRTCESAGLRVVSFEPSAWQSCKCGPVTP